MIKSSHPTIFIIFGATGDLAQKKLIPSLFRLWENKLIPDFFQLAGFSRREWTSLEFGQYVHDLLLESFGTKKESLIKKFSSHVFYQRGLFENKSGYAQLARHLGLKDREWLTCSNKLFYLAVPPVSYEPILKNIKASGLSKPCGPHEGWTRVIVEKPFGRDLETARRLDGELGKLFSEDQIYRIDHYLAKDTVQNILTFRFSNEIFEPLFNRDHVERIHFHFFEKIGIEGRGQFYDGIGAVRDVGQNHLMQFMAHFLMEHPGSFTAQNIRQKRSEIMSSLKIPSAREIDLTAFRAQYQGYRSEAGVSRNSNTETYFRLKAFFSSARWEGVPIYLEGGKALGEDKVFAEIIFKHPSPCLCPAGSDHAIRNILSYELKPSETIRASFWVKKPGHKIALEPREFIFKYSDRENGTEAYDRLLSDAFAGNQTLFVSTAEIMAQWRFIDPILESWRNNRTPIVYYPKNSHPISDPDEAAVSKPGTLGIIGLGKMGKNLARRLMNRGWSVYGYDSSAKNETDIVAVRDLSELISKLPRPRVVWLMVPSVKIGKTIPVDDVIFGKQGLVNLLEKGDLIIDGGNSFFEQTEKRARKLQSRGINFLDVGVSGGPEGALSGPTLMIGGNRKIFELHEKLFSDLAAPQAYGYFGKSGAGHFVKMVHNGIEYGMMQSIAEGFAIMKKSRFKPALKDVARVYNHGSIIESKLTRLLEEGFVKFGENLPGISGTVGHLGEGKWTAETAKKIGVDAPVISDSFAFRVKSAKAPNYTGKILSMLRHMFGGHDFKKKK